MKEQVQEVELAKKRCRSVIDRIERLPSASATTITHSCRRTLLKLAHSELNFLTRYSSSSSSSSTLSVNIGHLESVLHILQQPFINGVCRVCKPIPTLGRGVHVDIVCTLNTNPVWIIVSDRNPKYISWETIKLRLEHLRTAARSAFTLRPFSLILFFSNGLPEFVKQKLVQEFGASEINLGFSVFDFEFFSEDSDGEWVNVVVGRSYREACVLEIKVDVVSTSSSSSSQCDENDVQGSSVGAIANPLDGFGGGDSFCSLVSGMRIVGNDQLINFDTTALIAIVSGISNGGTDKLLATPESELRQRFKGNFEFVIGQVMSEIQNPIHVELGGVISGKKGIICESVHSEFKELVLMCGGPNEKLRADQLLKCLMIVPDSPSERVMGLPTTRKLALKNKVVFGTGDYWHAPTLTANMAFVRAISQTGMSLFTIEHRPRALTGDY